MLFRSLVALSAGVQRMVRSETGTAGVMFTLDTESGFRDVVFIVKDWDGVQDDQGNPLKFTAGACTELLEANIDFFLFVLQEGSKSTIEAGTELAETVEKQ